MIGIVDYGMGNLLSVYNAFDYLGESVKICRSPEELTKVERIVIPGVGAYGDCINALRENNLIEALNEEVLVKAKPTLGICLGMQIMANGSEESENVDGLGWIDADVIKIKSPLEGARVPNIGWNEVEYKHQRNLFKGIPQNTDFYLVHSYFMKCKDEENLLATYDYGFRVTAAVEKDNILATQFHPEKSQDLGIDLLINFLDWKP